MEILNVNDELYLNDDNKSPNNKFLDIKSGSTPANYEYDQWIDFSDYLLRIF